MSSRRYARMFRPGAVTAEKAFYAPGRQGGICDCDDRDRDGPAFEAEGWLFFDGFAGLVWTARRGPSA